MPLMTRIPSDLARFGLRVELVPGWETRGSASFAPACVVDHWTAGPRGTTKRPSLNVVVYGRTDLPGPLANIYLARDGTCVVVAAGRANHAGTGGWRGLVGNSAAYGIEAESGGDGDWTAAMLDAYPRLNAALLRGLGRDGSWVCGHNEWAPGRKIDIRDVIGRVRADTARHLAGGVPATNPEELDMDAAEVTKIVNDTVLDVLRKEGVSGGGISSAEAVRLLSEPIPSVIDPRVKLNPRDMLAAVDGNAWTMAQQVAALAGSLNAVAEALRKGSAGDGFTVDQAVAAGRAGAEAALSELGDKLRTSA